MERGILTNRPEFHDVDRRLLVETYDEDPNATGFKFGNELGNVAEDELERGSEVEDIAEVEDSAEDSGDDGDELELTIFTVTKEQAKWTHRRFAKEFGISEVNFQRVNKGHAMDFVHNSRFQLGTQLNVPVQVEEASVAIMASVLTSSEASVRLIWSARRQRKLRALRTVLQRRELERARGADCEQRQLG
jgi:hypothetical protein